MGFTTIPDQLPFHPRNDPPTTVHTVDPLVPVAAGHKGHRTNTAAAGQKPALFDHKLPLQKD